MLMSLVAVLSTPIGFGNGSRGSGGIMLTLTQKTWAIEFLIAEKSVDSMECFDHYKRQYGVRVDWHEWGGYLDELRLKGIARFAGPGSDGFRRYCLAVNGAEARAESARLKAVIYDDRSQDRPAGS